MTNLEKCNCYYSVGLCCSLCSKIKCMAKVVPFHSSRMHYLDTNQEKQSIVENLIGVKLMSKRRLTETVKWGKEST